MKKYQVTTASADIMKEEYQTELETELLMGEIFIAEFEQNGWVQGYCEHDGYKGWAKSSNFTADISFPTHIINVGHSIAFKECAIESTASKHLGFMSQVRVINKGRGRAGEIMSQISTGEWVMTAHLAEIEKHDEDIVKNAMKFLNAPYYWGGRSGFSGLDCSGLIQLVLARAGIKVPRNCKEQMELIGSEASEPKRGDIVYFKGHVGIMIDDTNIINTVGDRPRGGFGDKIGMITRIEPLRELAAFYDDGIIGIRRL